MKQTIWAFECIDSDGKQLSKHKTERAAHKACAAWLQFCLVRPSLKHHRPSVRKTKTELESV